MIHSKMKIKSICESTTVCSKYVNPEKSAHTNTIEAMWSGIKCALQNTPHKAGKFGDYLGEYMWRKHHNAHLMSADVFKTFLRDNEKCTHHCKKIRLKDDPMKWLLDRVGKNPAFFRKNLTQWVFQGFGWFFGGFQSFEDFFWGGVFCLFVL